MKNKAIIFLLFLCCLQLTYSEIFSQVIIRGQEDCESFYHVLNLIYRAPWHEEQGYNITLPEHKEFREKADELIKKENELKQLFVTDIYNKAEVKKSVERIDDANQSVDHAISKLRILTKNWGFKIPDVYEIVITHYGVGGSYNKNGKIIVLDKRVKEGSINRVIIHEMVHIGIEQNLVQKYNLTHWQKERIIDLICMLYLNDIIPYYRPNSLNEKNGDRRIDEFVDYDSIVNDLPAAIEKFAEKYMD